MHVIGCNKGKLNVIIHVLNINSLTEVQPFFILIQSATVLYFE